MRGFHRSLVNAPHKGQWHGTLVSSLICAWINGWVNKHEAADLRRHRAHHIVTVMIVYDKVVFATYFNRLVSQMRAPLVACHETAGKLWQLCKVLYVFEHIFKFMLHLPALWYFDTSVTYPQWFCRVKFAIIPQRVVLQRHLWNIAIQSAVVCYDSWANLRCSSCSSLEEKTWVKWDYLRMKLSVINSWVSFAYIHQDCFLGSGDSCVLLSPVPGK